MSTNISKHKRDILNNKIKELKDFIIALPADQNTKNLLGYLGDIQKEINRKKYGLVFEEHLEGIDTLLKSNMPILTEDKTLSIENGGEQNFLIEGDNLATLQLLEKTHKSKIDVIYIDPPYNTGNKDFIYDDNYVDSTDEFKHSKWLSFMSKRLTIAKELLNETGVIFISIDDNEQADLKILCNEIFGESQYVSTFQRLTTKSGKTPLTFMISHDSILCYSKKALDIFVGTSFEDDSYKYEDEYVDKRGRYNLKQPLDCNSISYSKSLDYPIVFKNQTYYPGGDFIKYQARKKGNYLPKDYAWRWSKELYEFGLRNGWIVFKNGRIYTKGYLNATIENVGGKYEIIYREKTRKRSTIDFVDNAYSNDIAKKQLLSFNLDAKFDYPKPYNLIGDLIATHFNSSSTILDFFAGSGTTGHAVLKLNAEDGGHRKFILCTNNENNICRDVTYQRLKTVITGKRKDGSIYSEGIPGSLKYFKVDYLPVEEKMYYEFADELLANIKELIELENGIDTTSDKSVSIIMDDEELEKYIKSIKDHEGCRTLYVSHNVLASSRQEQFLHKHDIEIKTIPEYFYPDTENRGGDEH